jgi:hypothetical protein
MAKRKTRSTKRKVMLLTTKHGTVDLMQLPAAQRMEMMRVALTITHLNAAVASLPDDVIDPDRPSDHGERTVLSSLILNVRKLEQRRDAVLSYHFADYMPLIEG